VPYLLYISSGNDVIVNEDRSVNQSAIVGYRHELDTGNFKSYVYNDYTRFSINVSWVDSAFKSVVNSWWSSFAPLTLVHSLDSYNVKITNTTTPIHTIMPQNIDRFGGLIVLETF
jgi:hypothetical protein